MTKIALALETKKVKKFIVTFFAVGLAGLIIPYTREVFLFLVPFTLIMSIFLLLFFHKNWDAKTIAAFIFIALSGYFIEVIGVNTGLIFGLYSYDYALGFEVFNTPLLIGVNWLLLIYCTYQISLRIPLPHFFKIFSASLMMLIFDLVLEPVAIKLQMWHWQSEHIPLQNYLAWFLISFFFISLLSILRIKIQNTIAFTLFFAQFGFFASLNILLRFIQ